VVARKKLHVPPEAIVTELDDELGYSLAVTGAEPLPALTVAVNAVCERMEDRADHSVLVLRLGPMDAFTREWPGAVTVQDVNRWERAMRRIGRLPAMTVGAAEGPCAGASLDLLLVTDFRLCSTDMQLLFPVNDGHFWPGMAVYGLVQQFGLARARRIVLWGEDITADQALRMGLVDRTTPDMPAALREAILMLGRISDRELAIRRQLMIEATTNGFDESLGVHLAACDRELRRLASTKDGERVEESCP
jgi:isomerase DpgB